MYLFYEIVDEKFSKKIEIGKIFNARKFFVVLNFMTTFKNLETTSISILEMGLRISTVKFLIFFTSQIFNSRKLEK